MTFETGKTYRTKNGHLLHIERRGPDRLFGKNNIYTIIYNDAGTPIGSGWAEFSLLPGAIEDEKQTAIPNDEKAIFTILESHQKQIDELRERWSPAPPPRTIKGGWVNVYDYGRGVLHISPAIFKTRDECECEGSKHRIACIQIPDIEEGEGL